MTLLDSITDAVQKVLPQKKESQPIPLNTPSGGIGHGIYSHEDDLILSKPAIVFHALQIFFVFIAMCCFASVAAFQAHWGVGPSGLSDLAIFISLIALFISIFLVTVPVLYDKYDKAVRLARALREVRVQFILTGAGVAIVPLIAFITTISAFTEPGCKNPENDPNAKISKDFVAGLPGWCQTKRAGAIFFWLAAIFYVASFAYAFLDWRRGRGTYAGNRPRDPPFTHPVEPPSEYGADDEEGYAPVRQPRRADLPRVSTLPPRIPDEATSPFGDEHAPPMPRASMDAYGAFDDPAPSGYGAGGNAPASPGGVSRTMQYADPYAAVRSKLATSPPATAAQLPPQYAPYR